MSYDIDYDVGGRIDYDVIEEESRRQAAMTIIEVLDEHIEELEEGLTALDGAKILLRRAHEIAIKYGPESSEWQDWYTGFLLDAEKEIEGMRKDLEGTLQRKRDHREDPLNEKKVAE